MIILKSSCIAWPSRTDCMAGFVSADYSFFFRCFCVSKYISYRECFRVSKYSFLFVIRLQSHFLWRALCCFCSSFFPCLDGLSRFPNLLGKNCNMKKSPGFFPESSVNKSIQDNASQLIFWKSYIGSKFAFLLFYLFTDLFLQRSCHFPSDLFTHET